MSSSAFVPLIDFQPFLNGDSLDREHVASAIDKALSSEGFFYLGNHGIDQSKVNESFDWCRRFFALPESTRLSINKAPESPCRGYVAFGEENVRQSKALKESFDFGQSDDPEGKNVWLPDEVLPGFRTFMEDYYQECSSLIYKLLDCLSLALNLDDTDSLSRHHANGLFDMSLIRYPYSTVKNVDLGGFVRMPAHSDFGSLTLLFQDNVGGLEIADSTTGDTVSAAKFEERGGRFKRVEPLLGTVVVNVGYLLMRWSNGRWKNTIHRVVAPSHSDGTPASNSSDFVHAQGGGGTSTIERYSIPFFASPDRETVVEALPGCWSDKEPKKWKPMNAGEYLRRKKKAVYE